MKIVIYQILPTSKKNSILYKASDLKLLIHEVKEAALNIVPTSKINIGDFEDKNQLNISFRSGFEKNTSKRLFYVYYYMKQFNRKNCVHIENDNHIYMDLYLYLFQGLEVTY